MGNTVSKEQIKNDLINIGVKPGDVLHLKVSMRAIGKIEGGAKSFLEILLDVVGEEGTIVSDAFIDAYSLPMSKEHSKIIVNDKTPSYAGAFANAMVKHPKSYRSKHPIQKFAAIGKKAKELTENHTDKSEGYDLIKDMNALDGKNLTIGKTVVGVGTTHIAIEKKGFKRQPINLGVNYINDEGEKKLFKVNWNGGCGKGFPNFIPLYYEKNGVIAEGKIGNAKGLLTSLKQTLKIEIEKLDEDPSFFFCNDPACYSCQMSWEHSPKNYLKFYYSWLKKNYKGLGIKRFVTIFKVLLKK